jgi:hypothetical protein
MPRLGIGMPLVSTATEAPVLAVQDFFWLNDISGELTPIHTASRTNLSTNNVTAWGTTNVTKIANDTTSPDGTENAARITATSITQPRTETGVSGGVPATDTTYTFSVFVKKGNTPYIALSRYSGSKYAIFNLDAKSVVSSDTENATIDEISNGWFKISITQTVLSTDSYNLWKVNLTNGTNQNTGVVGEYMYVWGGQVEQDSRVSAYIPTSGSAVTVTTPLNDTHNAWDYDSANLTLEEDPDSEGSWQRPSNVVLNHDFADLGAELVTNGGFATDTDWDKKNGSTISGGVGNVIANGDLGNDGANWSLNQDVGMIVGKTYKISFSVKQTGGTGNFQVGQAYLVGFNQSITSSFANYSFFITPTNYGGNTGKISIGGFVAGDTFEVDNVSVKQVDPNDRWTKNTGWTISDGTANKDSGDTNYLTQDFSGNGQFEITYTISGYVSGNVRLRVGTGFSAIIRTSNGTYTEYITKDSASFGFYGTGEFSIDNVTVKEYAAMPLDV